MSPAAEADDRLVSVTHADRNVSINVGIATKKKSNRWPFEEGNCVYTVTTLISVIFQVLDFQCHRSAMETGKVISVSQATEKVSMKTTF